MLFCFAPCVKLMFWYKISLTLTTKRASKRSDTERVFSVNSLTLTLAQSTCIRFRSAARLFFGEVRSKKETDQMSPEGQVSRKGRGESFGCLRPNCAASLQLGRWGGGGLTSNALT